MIADARFDCGDRVRVVRTVRNDGTFPGCRTGQVLVRRGSLGYVCDVGAFLQDQVIYAVDFLNAGRVVGCREVELIPADAPWTAHRFDVRDRVAADRILAVGGKGVAAAGEVGEVVALVGDDPAAPACDEEFAAGTFRVPESVLDAAAEEGT